MFNSSFTCEYYIKVRNGPLYLFFFSKNKTKNSLTTFFTCFALNIQAKYVKYLHKALDDKTLILKTIPEGEYSESTRRGIRAL